MKTLEGTSTKNSLLVVKQAAKCAQKTIVVLGVERGGTSMIAGIIRALGIDMGERAGRNHEDPRFLTDDEEVLLERIRENNEKKIWGFKVPKASLKLDFYSKHLRNPHYILVFRNIEATVDSWFIRGGADPLGTAEHVLKYYNHAIEYFKSVGAPLAFANYERACSDPENFVQSLVAFADIEVDTPTIKRACQMVTGEGGGYIDLPEYYFHVDSSSRNDNIGNKVTYNLDDNARYSSFTQKAISDRLVFTCNDKSFPESLILRFKLKTKERKFITERGLRMYFNFTGKFQSGHTFRPAIKNGWNYIKITTNGNAKQIALGPLENGHTFQITQQDLYELCGTENLNQSALSGFMASVKKLIK